MRMFLRAALRLFSRVEDCVETCFARELETQHPLRHIHGPLPVDPKVLWDP